MNGFPLSTYQLQQRIDDDSHPYSIGYTEGKRHSHNSEKGRKGFRTVMPVNINQTFHHKGTGQNQRRSSNSWHRCHAFRYWLTEYQ